MTTLLYTHPVFLEHDTGYGHPECPARLTAILNALKPSSFAALQWRDAPLAAIEQLTRIHTATHVERTLSRIPKHGHYAIDGDTIVSPQSGEAALRAAGAVCAAVDAILQGEADNAFCAIRPPGHHAEPNQAMGFCLFGNAAIGAAHARAIHEWKRVAVIDFDVHHGKGTQAALSPTRPTYTLPPIKPISIPAPAVVKSAGSATSSMSRCWPTAARLICGTLGAKISSPHCGNSNRNSF